MASIDKLILKLENLSDDAVKEALNKACLIVQNSAKEKVPVNTGNLRNSITYEVEGNEGIVGTNVEYAPYVEFGTGLFSSLGDGRQDVP
jgi:HK97 gp10 family phage protein